MGVRDQFRRAFYGAAVGNDVLQNTPIPSAANFLNTATAGVATGNYATAVGALTGNFTDLQGRSTRPYILEKHYVGSRRVSSFWYFGRCQDLLGRIIPGTERLQPYPLRVYADAASAATGLYGALPLGVQGVQGRCIITSARMDFRKASATAGSNGVASGAQGIGVTNVNTSVSGGGIAATAAGLYLGLAQGVIATNSPMNAVEASSTGVGASVATPSAATEATATSNLIKYSAVGTLSASAQNMAAYTTANTVITDSTGQTASTTFAALTGTVTSTVAGAALAQLAANENRRLGLFGALMAGTSAVQGLFLNVDSVTQADGTGASFAYLDDGIVGELLLNGVIEVNYDIVGDI